MIGYLVCGMVGFVVGLFVTEPMLAAWAKAAHGTTRVVSFRGPNRKPRSKGTDAPAAQ